MARNSLPMFGGQTGIGIGESRDLNVAENSME